MLTWCNAMQRDTMLLDENLTLSDLYHGALHLIVFHCVTLSMFDMVHFKQLYWILYYYVA